MSATPPAIAFVDPHPDWQRFPAAGMRLVLLLIEQTLKIGAREFMVLTVRQHHASVLVVADRTPLEITQLELQFYADMKQFLQEGLFRGNAHPHLEGFGSRWEASIEWVSRESGEGFTIVLKPYLFEA